MYINIEYLKQGHDAINMNMTWIHKFSYIYNGKALYTYIIQTHVS